MINQLPVGALPVVPELRSMENFKTLKAGKFGWVVELNQMLIQIG